MSILHSIRKFVQSQPGPHRPASLGDRGERAAIRYLKRRKYLIIAAGENLGVGELDIIAVDRIRGKRTLVFVEVKTRTSREKGQPSDAVDDRKQQQITRAAVTYIRRHSLQQYSSRFDVIAVMWPAQQRKPVIEHFPAAFEAITGAYD